MSPLCLVTCSELVHSAQSQGGGEGHGRRRKQSAVGYSEQQRRIVHAGMRGGHMERKDIQ